LAQPAQGGDVWACKPLKYTGSTFEKLPMNVELAEQLNLFAKYFGDLCGQVYVII
jgi:hypothetical protein